MFPIISINNKNATPLVRQNFLVTTLSLISILVLFGCAGGGSAPKQALPNYYPADTAVPVSGPDAVGAQPFDAGVSALLKRWNIPGAAIAVAKNGQLILARGYGYADFEAKQEMQPDFMFRMPH
jgi:CubicO group peptidase (beta-lactamase class C family)